MTPTPHGGGPASPCYSGTEFRILYLRIPVSAPQSWFTLTVPSSGPGMKNGGLALDSPLMLVTTSCGRGLSVGKDSFGYVRTNGWEKLVSEPLMTGMYPWNSVLSESKMSSIHTVLDDTPQGCSVTPSSLNAVAATPMHRPESTPNGEYSFSNAGSFTAKM